ncbi:hypothetical protein GCM10009558_033010 [Virgisporangium aurantiacum]
MFGRSSSPHNASTNRSTGTGDPASIASTTNNTRNFADDTASGRPSTDTVSGPSTSIASIPQAYGHPAEREAGVNPQ